MKKILSLILALTCVFSLISCGESTCEAHKDFDGDGYYCDICGAIFSCPDHVDADDDGACDTCGAAYECVGHADANFDGKCDRCKAPYVCPGHKDVNGVGRCDVCNAKFVCSHEDERGDGKCDKCLAPFTCANHKDYDIDGTCDLCKGAIDCGEDGHRDLDSNSICDICNQPYACSGFMDADADGTCDECGADELTHSKVLKPDSVAAFMYAYANSAPTKVTTKTVRTVGRGDSYTLTSSSTLLAGTIAGKSAAIYEETYQQLRDVESGSGNTEISVFETVEVKKEFVQGPGVRTTTNGKAGPWNKREASFVPTKGSIALRITEETIKDVKFTVDGKFNIMEFSVSKANLRAVFGTTDDIPNLDASGDVSVILTSNGSTISSVVIAYTVSATSGTPFQSVVIEANYEYSVQIFSID